MGSKWHLDYFLIKNYCSWQFLDFRGSQPCLDPHLRQLRNLIDSTLHLRFRMMWSCLVCYLHGHLYFWGHSPCCFRFVLGGLVVCCLMLLPCCCRFVLGELVDCCLMLLPCCFCFVLGELDSECHLFFRYF